jgi:hypothetical protein
MASQKVGHLGLAKRRQYLDKIVVQGVPFEDHLQKQIGHRNQLRQVTRLLVGHCRLKGLFFNLGLE